MHVFARMPLLKMPMQMVHMAIHMSAPVQAVHFHRELRQHGPSGTLFFLKDKNARPVRHPVFLKDKMPGPAVPRAASQVCFCPRMQERAGPPARTHARTNTLTMGSQAGT